MSDYPWLTAVENAAVALAQALAEGNPRLTTKELGDTLGGLLTDMHEIIHPFPRSEVFSYGVEMQLAHERFCIAAAFYYARLTDLRRSSRTHNTQEEPTDAPDTHADPAV